ncbi:MAG: hypothetical protein ACTSR2_14135 [Candidatus Hodarchaeales archaeon]
MSKNLLDRYHRFHEIYQEKRNVRIITSIFVAFSVFTVSLLLSIFIKPHLNSVLLETFFHDLPALGLVSGLVIAFQMLGLLPQPPKDDTQE